MNSKWKNKENVTSYQLEKKNFDKMGFPDLSKYKYPDKSDLLRNCVDPEIGKSILYRVVEIRKESDIKQQKIQF